MLMNLSVICQTVYPRKVVIDNDTATLISIEQTKTINKVFVDRDECNELKDSLNSQIKTYDALVKEQKNIITAQDERIEIQKKIVEEKDVIIASDEKLLKKQNRQVKWLKVQRMVLSVAVLTLGITVIILNGK